MQRNMIYYINQLGKERKSYQVSNGFGSDSFGLLSSFLCPTRVGDAFLSVLTFEAETSSTDMLPDITRNRLRTWIFMMATNCMDPSSSLDIFYKCCYPQFSFDLAKWFYHAPGILHVKMMVLYNYMDKNHGNLCVHQNELVSLIWLFFHGATTDLTSLEVTFSRFGIWISTFLAPFLITDCGIF